MEVYKELHCQLEDPERTSELIALLSALPFESFEVTADGCKAYLPQSAYDETVLQAEMLRLSQLVPFEHQWIEIEPQNWNALWEENYQRIDVSAELGIRAPHHDSWNDGRTEILIQPRMSFGTGHHATTRLVLRMMESIDIQGKRVLDAGCGTGVLAIYAAMREAGEVVAFDVEADAVENARENASRNHVKVEIIQARAELFKWRGFDLLMANINRNAILQCLKDFSTSLNGGGTMLLSGLLKEDEEMILAKAAAHGLNYHETSTEDEWICLKLTR